MREMLSNFPKTSQMAKEQTWEPNMQRLLRLGNTCDKNTLQAPWWSKGRLHLKSSEEESLGLGLEK
jgi:hypothetical protein